MNWLGVDVGWVFPAADSDGNIYEWTRRTRAAEPVTMAGPVTIVRADGSTSKQQPFPSQEAATVRARESALNVRGVAQRIVTLARDTDRGIALEDWSNFQKRKKAWVRVYSQIAERALERGVSIAQVDRAYTSLTCPRCDHKGRENRPTRDTFMCVRCAFAGQADVVAATNIARRAAGTFEIATAECENVICDEPSWKAGLCVFCYRFRWRRHRLPDEQDFVERAGAASVAKYREQARRDALHERRRIRDAEIEARQKQSYAAHDAWGNPRA